MTKAAQKRARAAGSRGSQGNSVKKEEWSPESSAIEKSIQCDEEGKVPIANHQSPLVTLLSTELAYFVFA